MLYFSPGISSVNNDRVALNVASQKQAAFPVLVVGSIVSSVKLVTCMEGPSTVTSVKEVLGEAIRRF